MPVVPSDGSVLRPAWSKSLRRGANLRCRVRIVARHRDRTETVAISAATIVTRNGPRHRRIRVAARSRGQLCRAIERDPTKGRGPPWSKANRAHCPAPPAFQEFTEHPHVDGNHTLSLSWRGKREELSCLPYDAARAMTSRDFGIFARWRVPCRQYVNRDPLSRRSR